MAFIRFVVLVVVIALLIKYFLRVIQRARSQQTVSGNRNPYAVLGISPNASDDEIKEAYRRELAKYHPDKVSHLGDDIQKVARDRTIEIINAYEALNKSR